MATEFEPNPFWDYSLEVYPLDGVSPALINFQDRHNLDVNIMLLCLWMGHSGRGVMDDSDFDRAFRISQNWNPEIVCAIRDIRIRLRQEIDLVPTELRAAIHKKLLDLEIECEHVEQQSLAAGLSLKEGAAGSPEKRLRDCGLNLKSYFDRKGCDVDAADRDGLLVILSAAFDELDPDKIRSFCGEMFV